MSESADKLRKEWSRVKGVHDKLDSRVTELIDKIKLLTQEAVIEATNEIMEACDEEMIITLINDCDEDTRHTRKDVSHHVKFLMYHSQGTCNSVRKYL